MVKLIIGDLMVNGHYSRYEQAAEYSNLAGRDYYHCGQDV